MVEPGWLILFVFMALEMALVLLLVAPMPSNAVRGAVTTWVSGLYAVPAFRYITYTLLAIDLVYFWYVFDALMHPLYDFGILVSPFEISCEVRAAKFESERNAYITSFSLFLALILNRLIDIQAKL